MRLLVLCLSLFGMIFSNDGLDGKDSTIPVLDLQKYYNEETKEEFLEEVRDALHKVGFFGVKNSGVNQEIIDNVYSTLTKFYAFDVETKMKVSAEFCNAQRGYVKVGSEAAKGSSSGDLKEHYMIGRDVSKEEHEKYHLLMNQWPDFIDLETPAMNFYNHLEEYSELFQEIFSLALYQEKDFFYNICKFGDTSCRMIHYPNTEAEPGQVWSGAHTDITLFTILPRSTARGLEVMDDKGIWHPVFVKEDAMIINCGDFLEAFSNGYFRSSMHRVKRPDDMDKDRYSSVHFVHPRSEAVVYPLPAWIEKTGGERKYAHATRWELLMERLADLGTCTPQMLEELATCGVMDRLKEVGRASPDALKRLEEAGLVSSNES